MCPGLNWIAKKMVRNQIGSSSKKNVECALFK